MSTPKQIIPEYPPIFLILLYPLLVYILDYMVVMTFNLGTYLGTVVRFIFERISC